jgi:hypothetical protein
LGGFPYLIDNHLISDPEINSRLNYVLKVHGYYSLPNFKYFGQYYDCKLIEARDVTVENSFHYIHYIKGFWHEDFEYGISGAPYVFGSPENIARSWNLMCLYRSNVTYYQWILGTKISERHKNYLMVHKGLIGGGAHIVTPNTKGK